MRLLMIGLGLSFGSVLAFSACGQDPSSQTSGPGGAPNCDDVTVVIGEDAGNACDVCLHEKCCVEIAACTNDNCLYCVNYHFLGCQYNVTVQTVTNCLIHNCHDICYPGLGASSGTGGSGGGASSSSGGAASSSSGG